VLREARGALREKQRCNSQWGRQAKNYFPFHGAAAINDQYGQICLDSLVGVGKLMRILVVTNSFSH
jgi:hypothetical protein